eukprot:CAMPEP_0178702874 /NCGR_PEP_ID=MMETSP0699-20121125/13171_1 /TAXON_ID=265572 /ORGANISM="Extubocellulus spinifer, Strain CCMP396" /LENGTH=47 /DNA_ID= /DNA_START= /DNA_END= /DNA_ORIENTATION=
MSSGSREVPTSGLSRQLFPSSPYDRSDAGSSTTTSSSDSEDDEEAYK